LAIIKQLGIVSQLRGLDGSGVFQTRAGGFSNGYRPVNTDEVLYKTYSPFSSLMDEAAGMKGNKELLNSVIVDVIIGHVRASTHGVVSDANAHPFQIDHIVGAHNGTLKDTKYTSHPVKTDSELMFKDISKRGIETVLTELDRDSAFAIVMYDRNDRSLYFARNELRTLAFAFNKKRGVMYWASEVKMLKFILDRFGQEYKAFTLHENLVIKINPSDITMSNNAKEDPLGVLTVHKELDRPLPTVIQKARDELAKKKQQEQAKVNHTVTQSPKKDTQMTNWTPDQYSFQMDNKEDDKGKILPFKVSNCYTRCVCGKTTLNLLQTNQTHRGIHPLYRYDKETKKIYCDKCPDNKIECKEVTA
jgi:hypothetical protein